MMTKLATTLKRKANGVVPACALVAMVLLAPVASGQDAWRQVSVTPRTFMYDIAFSDSLTGWIAARGAVLTTSDGGNHWTTLSLSGLDDVYPGVRSFTSVFVTSPSSLAFVARNDRGDALLSYSIADMRWRVMFSTLFSDTGRSQIVAADMHDARHGVVVTRNGIGERAFLHYTFDSGRTWRTSEIPFAASIIDGKAAQRGTVSRIAMADSVSGAFLGRDIAQRLFRFERENARWSDRLDTVANGRGFFESIAFNSSDALFVAGRHVLRYQAGIRSRLSDPPETIILLSAGSSPNWLAATASFLYARVAVYRSIDDGHTWTLSMPQRRAIGLAWRSAVSAAMTVEDSTVWLLDLTSSAESGRGSAGSPQPSCRLDDQLLTVTGLPGSAAADIRIVDLLGQTLLSGHYSLNPFGVVTVSCPGAVAGAGPYFYRIASGGRVFVGRCSGR